MKNHISYHWGDEYLLINLGNRINPRIKALFWAEFVFTCGMATIFLIRSIPFAQGLVHVLSATGAALLYILASYRFLSRMFYKEKVLLDPESIIITYSTPFNRKVSRYDWQFIGPLHYKGTALKTAHPLKGNCYDYFGFETQEHLIQNLHQEGNLYFNFGGFPVCFAKGVYSWHAEEMVHMMRIYAGDKLRLGPEWKSMLQHEWDDA